MAALSIREHRPVHVFEMMERLGIEPSSSVTPRSSLTYATAVHRCEVCQITKTVAPGSTMRRHRSVLLRNSVQTQTSYLNCNSIKSDPTENTSKPALRIRSDNETFTRHSLRALASIGLQNSVGGSHAGIYNRCLRASP